MLSYARPRQSGRRFHLGLYRDAINRYQSLPQNSDLLDQVASGPEDLLAMYEVYTARLGIEPLQGQVLSNQLSDKQISRIKLLEKKFRKGKIPLDRFSVRYIVDKLYLLGISPHSNLLEQFFLRWKYTISFSEALRQRATLDLVSHGIEEALTKSSNIKSVSVINRFRRFRKRYPNVEQSIITMAFLSFRLFQSLPVLLPAYTLRKAKAIPKELMQKILNEGFQAAKPELKKMYKFSIEFNRAFDLACLVYTTGMLSYYGYFFLRDYQGVRYLLEIDSVDDNKLDKLQAETFDAHRIRLEQLENWKNSIVLFENRHPTQEQILEQWKELEKIPDNELRVQYPK